MLKRAPVTQHTSSSRACVSVMQAADLRNRSRGPALRCLDFSGNRGVAIQGQMRPRLVVIFKVLGKDAFQVRLVEHDHVIQAFATNRRDQSLDVGILPRCPRRADDFLNAETFHSPLKFFAVDAVAITHQVARRGVIGKRFRDLLSGPRGTRVGRDVEVRYPPAAEITNLAFDFGSTSLSTVRFPAPIEPKSLAVPTDDCSRLHDHQRGSPTIPNLRQANPVHAAAPPQPWASNRPTKRGQLLAERNKPNCSESKVIKWPSSTG